MRTQFNELALDSPDAILEHYGIKGMKWGVRRDKNKRTSSSTSNSKKRTSDEKKTTGKMGEGRIKKIEALRKAARVNKNINKPSSRKSINKLSDQEYREVLKKRQQADELSKSYNQQLATEIARAKMQNELRYLKKNRDYVPGIQNGQNGQNEQKDQDGLSSRFGKVIVDSIISGVGEGAKRSATTATTLAAGRFIDKMTGRKNKKNKKKADSSRDNDSGTDKTEDKD